MKNFILGIVIYLLIFVFMPTFTFCLLSFYAVSPAIAVLAFSTLGLGFAFVFVVFMNAQNIKGNTPEARRLETLEFRKTLPPEYEPNVVHDRLYSQGRIFQKYTYGKQREAYILDDKSVLLTDRDSGTANIITIPELRQMRGAENTGRRRARHGR